MQACFVELPAFERIREDYLDDLAYVRLQSLLLLYPEAGGLRKLRFGDSRRGKGKRGGLRVIYYYWTGGPEFWLFTLYDKDEASDLTPKQRAALRELLKRELKMRRRN